MPYLGVEPKIGVFTPQIIHLFIGVFHYKPSILGYPYFWIFVQGIGPCSGYDVGGSGKNCWRLSTGDLAVMRRFVFQSNAEYLRFFWRFQRQIVPLSRFSGA